MVRSYLFFVSVLLFSVAVVRGKEEDKKEELKNGSVTYDSRSLIINGKRELLFSGSIHYPRVPVEMWDDILDKSKEGGLNVIQTYTFWNAHEPVKGQFDFSGNYDVVKFIKKIGEKGMYATLRVGPFIQAEWNQGGLPYWLREERGIIYRTDNPVYKEHMEKWVTKIINMMKDENLFAPQGGPIILAQIENEYDHVIETFEHGGEKYIKWAGDLATSLDTGVPWLMCKQKNAPGQVINACNGRHCGDTFIGPNAPTKPFLWTENWTAQYRVFGDPPAQRAAEEIAFSVARWFSKNGSHVNYYMYYGGTNYGRTAAAFVTTRYYDEGPIDEFGMKREPKWGHLKELHRVLMQSKKALLEGTYGVEKFSPSVEARYYEKADSDVCAAFLWNNNTHEPAAVKFRGKDHYLPPKSISILPDCKTVVYNTDNIVAQHSTRIMKTSEVAHKNLKWEMTREPIPTTGDIMSRSPTDQYFLSKDTSDYVWYTTSVELDSLDLPFKKSLIPVLQIVSLGHSLLVFVNGEFVGTEHGIKRAYTFPYSTPIRLKEGTNRIAILGTTIGMPDSGAYMEHRYAGLRTLVIQGLGTGNLDLTLNGWQQKVALQGERRNYSTEEGSLRTKWTPVQDPPQPLTWYKTYFSAPEGDDPVAIKMENMTKGMVWVNGQSIGRHWSSYLTPLHKPSQSEYHIPRSFLKPKDNFLVIFDEAGGNIDTVEILTVNRDTICSIIPEYRAPAEGLPWKRGSQVLAPVLEDPHPEATLECPPGKVVDNIEFASFGNSYGICGLFLLGNCTSPDSVKVVEQQCMGKEKCTIPVEREYFDKGGNLCPTEKASLSVQVHCGRPRTKEREQ